jgi:hypothetical protein
MLLPTKNNEGAWRYHSSGSFASAEVDIPIIYRHETSFATPSSSAPPPHRSPNDNNNNNNDDPMTRIVGDYDNDAGGVGDALLFGSSSSSSGNKRPLATSIQELEQGWLRVRSVSKSSNDLAMVDYSTNSSSSGEGGGWGTSSRDSCVINDSMDDDDDNVLDDDDDDDAGGNDNGRVNKRRRFASPYATTTMKVTPVQRVRIDPMTRPSARMGGGGMMVDDEMTGVTGLVDSVNNNNHDRRHDIKAGWYEGQLHENTGLRHGHGITHHDDGTTYEGPYINDNMNGPNGRYTFGIQHKLIPDPIKNYHAGTTEHYLRRVIEVIHTGSFRSNVPHGVGTTTIRTIDYVPTNVDAIRSIEIVYDIGVYVSTRNEAVGEGVRVVYRSAIDPIEHRAAINVDGQVLWEKSWFRLFNGQVTTVRVSEEYAAWIVQCMEAVYPGLPAVDDTMMMAMMRPSAVGSRPLY